jgi:hypothetical protein
MKMILIEDKVYAKLLAEIKADKGLQGELASKQGVACHESLSWAATLAKMVLGGTVSVPDVRKPELPIRKMEFIRYGYDAQGRKKNVLYTIKDETQGVIYYGVSRCDLRYDQFKRDEGVEMAKKRAKSAQSIGHNVVPRFKFLNHKTDSHKTAPMYGVARGDAVHELLEWFDDIG